MLLHLLTVHIRSLLQVELGRVQKLADKCDGFREELPYEQNIKLIASLGSLMQVSATRPHNWQLYCYENGMFELFV